MKNIDSVIEKHFNKIMLGLIGAGLAGEVLSYAVTGETLPSEGLAGFYRGFLYAGPALILGGRRLLDKSLESSKVTKNTEE
ncbi:MAG: hypothetical protein ABIB71_02780 [Candidatus Woesearchaeota archaeon]